MPLVTDVSIFNAACRRLGIATLSEDGFDEESDEGAAAQDAYRDVVEFNLGIHLFAFAREIRRLSVIDGVMTLSGYTRAYDIPAEALGDPIYVTDDPTRPDRRFSAYAIIGRTVETDASPCWAQIRIRPSPERWSPAFRTATITALAARLALSIREDQELADRLHREAYGGPDDVFRGGQLGAAIRVDGFGTPPRRPNWENNPLTRAWRGTGAGSEDC